MSFDSLEQSQQDSQPIDLFQFKQGSAAWRYTNYPKQILKIDFTWVPRAITRSTITKADTVPKDTIVVNLPFDDNLVPSLRLGILSKPTQVIIFRTQADVDFARVMWRGRVAKTIRNGPHAAITCEPIFGNLLRMGITQPYSRSCRHVFGGPGCFVDTDSYKVHAQVASVDGAKVQLLLLTPPNFIGGTFVTAGGESRMVIAQSGSTVTLIRRVSVAAADFVDVIPSCDRSLGTCDTVYHNAGNFGGFPGIPLINPFTVSRSVF
jgi:uncharacterized phage protein (TIGR02218 family)